MMGKKFMSAEIQIIEPVLLNTEQAAAVKAEPNSQTVGFSELMTEAEVIDFLRIPAVARGEDYHNVIVNLKRIRGLPCVHICRQPLYPLSSIRRWITEQAKKERAK